MSPRLTAIRAWRNRSPNRHAKARVCRDSARLEPASRVPPCGLICRTYVPQAYGDECQRNEQLHPSLRDIRLPGYQGVNQNHEPDKREQAARRDQAARVIGRGGLGHWHETMLRNHVLEAAFSRRRRAQSFFTT